MTLRLTFRSAVAEDVEQATRWYDERRFGLGDEFIESFRSALKDLSQRPLTAGIVHRDIRRFPLRRFPYGIFTA